MGSGVDATTLAGQGTGEITVAGTDRRFFVVTGGPGSGKSTLVSALAGLGLATVPEAGRAIIQDQLAVGGTALPWADRAAFAELLLGWEMRSYREAAALSGPVVFDRGVPDVVGYLKLCGLAVPAHFVCAVEVFRYAPTVFLAPHWPEIYEQDAERKQSAKEAEATCRAVAEAYLAAGYELAELPKSPVEERVKYVMRIVRAGNAG
jgi:predicted ATPase